jgi:Phasin protein
MFPQFQFPNFSAFPSMTAFPGMSSFPGMQGGFPDMTKFSPFGTANPMAAWGDFGRNWQAVATEMTEYSKRAVQDGSATMEKLMTAKSVEQAFEIQTSYAKRSYEDYLQEMTKLGTMATSFGKT